MPNVISIFESLIENLPLIKDLHTPSGKVYPLISLLARNEALRVFSDDSIDAKPFPPFGNISFPYFKMGAIDSVNLFALDEFILFSFYWVNKHRYKKVLDVGANIGLHSIVMSRCGFEVSSFEPDPIHFEQLVKNLERNQCSNVTSFKAAVSTKKSTSEFVRVLGNTTSSHIKGDKVPYGTLETLEVDLVDFKDLLQDVDLIKMDVEGHEKKIILSTNSNDWDHVDALVEVGSEENRLSIYEHLQKIGVHLFAQKIGWKKVNALSDMPSSHREGSIFISKKKTMPW